MNNQKIEIFRSGEGNQQTAQTSGMQREEMVSTSNAWVGMVQTKPKFTSGWHHHGEYDTYVYIIQGELELEFGKGGEESRIAQPGEVAFIPQNTVHREANPSGEEQVLFVVRVGQGAPVFNVESPKD